MTMLPALPREFEAFRGIHAEESVVVCGCGASLAEIVAPERYVTIGVNDVGRLFDPDYLVVLNPLSQFSGDRFRYVQESKARAIFTQLALNLDHSHVVPFRLGRRGGTELDEADALPYTRNSPYVAVMLAMHMGARRIGLLGVDFTEDHFFAATGTHPLTNGLEQINTEYERLYESCRRQGIEVFNLSVTSRITAFPRMTQEEFAKDPDAASEFAGRKIFFVNHVFRSCGGLFGESLGRAAETLHSQWEMAEWDDAMLEEKVAAFKPDLLFVVHGRGFAKRWGGLFSSYKSAVWLLDEPYEVDETRRISSLFGTVFVNDLSTLERHKNAQYLPVCYDPGLHCYGASDERIYAVGFVGGYSAAREEALVALAGRGMLSYVAGGPWSDPALSAVAMPGRVSADEAAALYRQTKIVLNVFRSDESDCHERGVSLNPRVYEGLSCGALVISEYRPEFETLCPELPTFRNAEEMLLQVERYLGDTDLYTRVRRACIRRLARHTYAQRLTRALWSTLGNEKVRMISHESEEVLSGRESVAALPPELEMEWKALGDGVRVDPLGMTLLRSEVDSAGSVQGLEGKKVYEDLILEFEVRLHAGVSFVAAIHSGEERGGGYRVVCRGGRCQLVRHERSIAKFVLPLEVWVPISILYFDKTVVVRRSGAEIGRCADAQGSTGYCLLGVTSGAAELRDVRITLPLAPGDAVVKREPRVRTEGGPKVSIVTTVYDRVECLERCIDSVEALSFRDYEHIVVADAPPAEVLEQIEAVIRLRGEGRNNLTLVNLETRSNDWGVTPAAEGLRLARGEYVCFLSDDNGYLPHHFQRLVTVLDRDVRLGFVYSSCLYNGGILNSPVPRIGHIDLGQPLFRRELFEKYLGGGLPFHEHAWDWRMIERLMACGVRWRHVNEATFIFRLASYPHLMAEKAQRVDTSCAISYCIACLRPTYCCCLIDELVLKTSVAYEILLWINVSDEEFERFVEERVAAGVPIRIVGRTADNIGMAAYRYLFAASRAEMVVQIDDDVVCISPGIAEVARTVFDCFPTVGMLTADVWQDEFTTGARPGLEQYRVFNEEAGLYDGPIDGWFAVYRKSSLALCGGLPTSRYFALGHEIKSRLEAVGQHGLLCRQMRVFHVTGPAYAAYFEMLESEIRKYRAVGREALADWYRDAKVPAAVEMSERVAEIRANLQKAPAFSSR